MLNLVTLDNGNNDFPYYVCIDYSGLTQ